MLRECKDFCGWFCRTSWINNLSILFVLANVFTYITAGRTPENLIFGILKTSVLSGVSSCRSAILNHWNDGPRTVAAPAATSDAHAHEQLCSMIGGMWDCHGLSEEYDSTETTEVRTKETIVWTFTTTETCLHTVTETATRTIKDAVETTAPFVAIAGPDSRLMIKEVPDVNAIDPVDQFFELLEQKLIREYENREHHQKLKAAQETATKEPTREDPGTRQRLRADKKGLKPAGALPLPATVTLDMTLYATNGNQRPSDKKHAGPPSVSIPSNKKTDRLSEASGNAHTAATASTSTRSAGKTESSHNPGIRPGAREVQL